MPEQVDDPLSSDADDLALLRGYGARLGSELPAWEDPPADLWARIAGEAGVPDAPENPVVVPLAPRSRRRGAGGARPWLLAVAAAAAAVVLVVGGLVVTRRDDGDQTVVASTTLDRLGPAGSGDAELVEHDGQLSLRVDTSGLDPGDGFLEVWVIDPKVSKLVSLGPLRPDGTYDLPAGLDPRAFPIVDVSVEPLDGNPTHSGDSVLRGTLRF